MLALFALTPGCRKEEIRAYRVPKEKPLIASSGVREDPPAAMPQLEWKLPAGWEERGPGRMSVVASFWIPSKAGPGAEVSVMPMPGESASNLSLLVNIVRQGAGMEPISDEDLAKLVEEVKVGESTAKLVDLSGATAASGEDQENRIVLAVLTRSGTTWFFKMAGSAAVVSSQKGVFLDFLKAITFREADGESVASASATRDAGAKGDRGGGETKPKWEIPQGWQAVPPTQMLLAKFLLAGQGGSRAEVTVSVFPGDVGGLMANVNRWRRQIGLSDVGEAELPRLVSALDVEGGKAMLVDMSGQDAKTGKKSRLIGVVLPRGGETWFYKLMGDETVAAEQKAAFIKFVQTAEHPNAA